MKYSYLTYLTILLLPLFSNCNGQSNSNNSLKEYFENGQIKFERDTISGISKSYYPNGQLEQKGTYLKNKWIDTFQRFSEQGELIVESTSNEDGKLTERTFSYYYNGNIMIETFEYFEGVYTDPDNFKFHSIRKAYFPNKQICEIRRWVNNEEIKLQKWYSNGEANNEPTLNEEEILKKLKVVSQSEKDFVNHLKQNRLNKCLEHFPSYGSKDSLIKELKQIAEFFKNNTKVEQTTSLGKSPNGIGNFGHDTDGEYEKQSSYLFMDNDEKPIFKFSIYYTEQEPIGIIKYFSTQDLSNMKPLLRATTPSSSE